MSEVPPGARDILATGHAVVRNSAERGAMADIVGTPTLGAEIWGPEDELALLRNQVCGSEEGLKGVVLGELKAIIVELAPTDLPDQKLAKEVAKGCHVLTAAIHKHHSQVRIGNEALPALAETYFSDIIEVARLRVPAPAVNALYHEPEYFEKLFEIGYTRGLNDSEVQLAIKFNQADPLAEVENYADLIWGLYREYADNPDVSLGNVRQIAKSYRAGAKERIELYLANVQAASDQFVNHKFVGRQHIRQVCVDRVSNGLVATKWLVDTVDEFEKAYGDDPTFDGTVAVQAILKYPKLSTELVNRLESRQTDELDKEELARSAEAGLGIRTRLKLGRTLSKADMLALWEGNLSEKLLAMIPSTTPARCEPQPGMSLPVRYRRTEFFYSKDERDTDYALGFCASCEIVDLCLETAIVNGETYGIWGGKTPLQRYQFSLERALINLRDNPEDPALEAAVEVLPDDTQAVLKLRQKGRSQIQISKLLDIPESTVRGHLIEIGRTLAYPQRPESDTDLDDRGRLQ